MSEAPVYTVRVSEGARRQIDAEIARLFDAAGEAYAVAWRDGLAAALAGLATLPERCPLAPENDLYPDGTLRQLLYRPRRGGATWHILFSLRAATGDDPPTARVLQVRHGAQAPLTDWPVDAP